MTTTCSNTIPGGAGELLAAGRDVAAGLREVKMWQLTEDDLIAFGRELEVLQRSLLGAQVRFAAEVDTRGLAITHAKKSTAQYLADLVNIHYGDAKGRIDAAKAALPVECDKTDEYPDGEMPARLPLVGQAMDNGDLGADQLRAIVDSMNKLPADAAPDDLDAAEQLLVDNAAVFGAKKLRDIGKHLEAIMNPDGKAPDDDLNQASKMELHFGTRRNGLTPVHGYLDDPTTEYLRQALEALAKPKPGPDGERDTRSHPNRLAWALHDVAKWWSTHGNPPTVKGHRAHASVVIDIEALTGAVSGAAELGFVGATSSAVASLIACDAGIAKVIVDRHHSGGPKVVDVIQDRFFTANQRKFLAVRDGGCAFPGCEAFPGWCDAHHIVFVENGGPTVVNNGVLLCSFHHHLIHKGEWCCRMNPDDLHPEFIPPPWVDPEQQPRRHHRITTQSIRAAHDLRRCKPPDPAVASDPIRRT